MNRNKMILHGIFALSMSINLFAANAPIQRIDVVNLLGAGGSVPTSVTVAFENGVATPCFTTTLPYQGTITVWAGAGQTCGLPIINVVVTPASGAGGTVYSSPNPVAVSSNYYLTQLAISQNTAPIFDPNNGALLMAGTTQIGMMSY